MKRRESEYTARVDAWLAAHGIAAKIERTGSVEGFPGEKAEPGKRLMFHDTYCAMFTRGGEDNGHGRPASTGKSLVVSPYHQSAASSESQIARARCSRGCSGWKHTKTCAANPDRAEYATAYDILSSITKSDPGTFAYFCADMGYDKDSRSAERTYFAVQDEWVWVRAFFTAEELEELLEVAS